MLSYQSTLEDLTKKKVQMEGWAFKKSKKGGKQSNSKKRYTIIKDTFLFYFEKKVVSCRNSLIIPNKKTLKPLGVAALEYMSVSFDTEKKTIWMTKGDSFSDLSTEYSFNVESAEEFTSWQKVLSKMVTAYIFDITNI